MQIANPPRGSEVRRIGLIILITFAAYLPVLRNGFIWDDDDHFTRNPAMTARDGLRQIWSTLAVSRYYPLTLTTFWAQRRLWGLNPAPYHVVNIILHAANAALLFVLLCRLNVRGAWVAAALWAVHPVNVESVAWCTELKNTQSGLFFLLSLFCFLRFTDGSRPVWYAGSLFCCAAALLSKPSTVVLPLVVLLLAWWKNRCITRMDMLRTAPFFVLAVATSLVTVAEQRAAIARGVQEWSLAWHERLAVAGAAIWFYAAKLVCPVNLAFVYPRWDLHSSLRLAPLVGVLVAIAALWRRRDRWVERTALFGVGYFVIALLPVLGWFDVYYFRYAFVADHFQYLASIGPLALVTAGVASVTRSRRVQQAVAAAVLAFFVALSARRAATFHDNETLWRETLRQNPRAFLAHNNLGRILAEQKGRYAEAVERFREALRLRPNFLEAHSNLGLALIRLGRLHEAVEQFQEALRLKPDDAVAHMGLGRAYQRLNRLDDAIGEYESAARSDPHLTEARVNLGVLLQQIGRPDDAIRAYRAALAIRPDDFAAHFNLGNAYLAQTNRAAAMEHYRSALALASTQGHADLMPQIQAQLKALERRIP